MMQAFAYHHLVPAKDWMVRVIGAGRARAAWKPSDEKPVKLAAKAPSRIVLPMPRMQGPFQLALNEPPEGIAIRGMSAVREGVALQVHVDPAKVKPGLKGNLIVEAFLERPANKKTKQAAGRRQPLGTLPAIPFEVVAP